MIPPRHWSGANARSGPGPNVSPDASRSALSPAGTRASPAMSTNPDPPPGTRAAAADALPPHPRPRPVFSLRWKALVALSVVLALVNFSLALVAYDQLTRQFSQQQAQVRARQALQLTELIEDRYRQMLLLANVLPLLGNGQQPDLPPDRRLQAALTGERTSSMLQVDWDIGSVHWVTPDGRQSPLWHLFGPASAEPLPSALIAAVISEPEQIATRLACDSACYQYLAAPLLWGDTPAGALVISRPIDDALHTFYGLTGANVAIPSRESDAAGEPDFAVMTQRERTEPLFRQALASFAAASAAPAPSVPATTWPWQVWREILARAGLFSGEQDAGIEQLHHGYQKFEVYRLADLAPDIDVLILNDVSAEREAIAAATRASLVLGVLGLVLSEGLLLLVMRTPLRRLRRMAQLLPLLAEQRFAELRQRLSASGPRRRTQDEIDLIVASVHTLSERMEAMEDDRAKAHKKLKWLADHDSLTRLSNRRRFDAELQRHLRDAGSTSAGQPGALMFLDLDQFKDVNDISGHHMGDELLVEIARRLEAGVGSKGLLGRLGGDEFGLILPGADREAAIALAGRLQATVQSVVIRTRSWRHQVSASIGIVLFPDHGSDAQQLMAAADLAMYQAKEKGRGRWHLFSVADQGRERANARVIWAERIAAALAEDRYELHLQPIMEIATGLVWRAEALLRMRDHQGRLVLPCSFIPIAEETGQIKDLDRWVLNAAVALIQQRPALSLSVNLSAHAMQDPDLPTLIQQLLAHQPIDPSHLTFEVTESVAINSLRSATRLMRSIQALGCRFALDDFGSGFASYAYLRQLPVDDVKIDGAFVRDIVHSQEDRIFVRAVTEMAHGMGKRVIAEFVENEAILAQLQEIGVDFAQGYHIGRPAAPGPQAPPAAAPSGAVVAERAGPRPAPP